MDQNEFKLRQALLGENGVVARFHQQITEARQPNIPYVYVLINRQRVKISKTEISRWLRSTSYFKHLSYLKTDNQFLEAVYNDSNLNQLAQRPERVLSPNVINTLVAMTHLNEPDQEEALIQMVDQEEEAGENPNYIPERNDKVNNALKTQLEEEKKHSGEKKKEEELEKKSYTSGSQKPSEPEKPASNEIQAEEINLDRGDLHLQRIAAQNKQPPPEITPQPASPQKPLVFRRIANNLSPKNTPSFLKNLTSKGQILVSKVLKNPMVVSSVVGGLAGGALGLGVTGTTQGALIGTLTGGSLPMAAKTGALKGLFGLGSKGAAGLAGRGGLAAAGAASGPVGWALLAASLAPNIKSWIQKYLKWIIAIIVIFIFLFFVFIPMNLLKTNSLFPPFEQPTSQKKPPNTISLLKKGTAAIANGGTIDYQITLTFQGSNQADITVTDRIPDAIQVQTSTINESGTHQPAPGKNGGGVIKWEFKKLSPGTTKTLIFTAQALNEANNSWVTNQAEAVITQTFGLSGAGGSCPTPEEIAANRKTTPETCKYFNLGVNIFEDITEDQINLYIERYWKESGRTKEDFTEKTRIIVDKVRNIGLNPIIYLGYWKSESGFGDNFGCKINGSFSGGFGGQLECALSQAVAPRCASPKNPNRDADCKFLKGIRENTAIAPGRTVSNVQVYANYPISYPITTFDDFAEAYGSKAPLLSDEEKIKNFNCINTYNTLAEVATNTNSCKVTNIPAQTGNSGFNQCTFVKRDQTGDQCSEGKTCQIELPYKSQKLLSYFQEVSQKTGVPAPLLASIARVESTTKKYTISDYTDEDITKIENNTGFDQNIDAVIPGTNKAMCPRSMAGAVGLMQIQPSEAIHESLRQQLLSLYGNREQKEPIYATENEDYNRQAAIKPYAKIGAHDAGAVNNGAKFIGKTVNNLTLTDYCNPKTSIYLAAGFILEKLKTNGIGDGSKWNPSWTNNKTVVDTVAKSYYGALSYGPNNEYSYGDDIFSSIVSCEEKIKQQPTVTSGGLACPVKETFVSFNNFSKTKPNEYSYACYHHPPINNAIDIYTYSRGGTSVIAVTDGVVQDLSNPGSGPSLFLVGDDGKYYFYGHLKSQGLVTGRVQKGQTIGFIADDSDRQANNNGTAHIHFEVSLDPNTHSKSNPTRTPAGPYLDQACQTNVCTSQ